jgi:ABC-2 type transport system ATP-binding protein
MVQRLGVAVALLPDVPVLVLDEPAASLDPGGATKLRELVWQAKRRRRTILFSTHVLTDVELLADRAAILVSGKLVAVKSVPALREELAASARLGVTLRNSDERFVRAVRAAGARHAELVGSTLWVNCQPEGRSAVLGAVEKAGGVVEEFFTEKPPLDEIYLRYVNAKSADSVSADFVGLRAAVPETS